MDCQTRTMDAGLKERLLELKTEKNAVLLAHNYQRPELQEIADYLGDSLDLAMAARDTEADIILFAGVDFMAETAKMLNPSKKVIVPNLKARCTMAHQLPAELLREYREAFPEAAAAIYVNTLAEAKAEADVVFTSTNAVKVARALDEKVVIMGPDINLTKYVERRVPEKKFVPVPDDGGCYVHRVFKREMIDKIRQDGNGEIMLHPEVDYRLHSLADFIGSTQQMFRRPAESNAGIFYVGTETGLVHRMQGMYAGREIRPLYDRAVCCQMKMNNLQNAYEALLEEKNQIEVPDEIAKGALKSISRMLEIGK